MSLGIFGIYYFDGFSDYGLSYPIGIGGALLVGKSIGTIK